MGSRTSTVDTDSTTFSWCSCGTRRPGAPGRRSWSGAMAPGPATSTARRQDAESGGPVPTGALHWPAMSRELPIFMPPGVDHDRHGAAVPSKIAIGGAPDFDPVGSGDGAAAGRRHPDWLKAKIGAGDEYQDLRRLVRGLNLNTVCEEARCPNIGECWDQRTATVMILGDTCTRACGFCAIKTGRPTWFDADEPRRVAEAVAAMGLEHVVVTSVARAAVGQVVAGVFAETIRQLRDRCPGMGVEVLIPDFNGAEAPLRTVMEAGPDILNHNVETVERLQAPVRKRAHYDRSLGVLAQAHHDRALRADLAAELGGVRLGTREDAQAAVVVGT